MGTQAQGEREGGSRSQFTVAVHDSQFTVHDSQFTIHVHETNRERERDRHRGEKGER